MRRWLVPTLLLAAAALARAGDSPAAVTVKAAGDVDFHASGSLPPGAEYHLIYEDKVTHGVQTVVRFPRGYSLPKHSHSADEVVYLVKGKLTLTFGDRKETLSPGGYAVIPAGTEFAMESSGFGGAQFLANFNAPYDVKPAPAPAR